MQKPKYNKEAVDKAIKRDPRIKGQANPSSAERENQMNAMRRGNLINKINRLVPEA